MVALRKLRLGYQEQLILVEGLAEWWVVVLMELRLGYQELLILVEGLQTEKGELGECWREVLDLETEWKIQGK